jgi:hypothetical protein
VIDVRGDHLAGPSAEPAPGRTFERIDIS